MNQIIRCEESHQKFEDIKHINEDGLEFWYARELQKVLDYTEWRNFSKMIDKAKDSCINSSNIISDHFVDVNKMVDYCGGAKRKVDVVMLTRYACCLVM